jgi:hypothetical protein
MIERDRLRRLFCHQSATEKKKEREKKREEKRRKGRKKKKTKMGSVCRLEARDP